MKILILITFFATNLCAMEPSSFFKQQVLKQDYCALESCFASEIDLDIDGENHFDICAQEAGNKLQDFFMELKISSFKEKFISNSKEKKTKVYIDDIKDGLSNTSYKVTIVVEKDIVWQVVSIEISKYSPNQVRYVKKNKLEVA